MAVGELGRFAFVQRGGSGQSGRLLRLCLEEDEHADRYQLDPLTSVRPSDRNRSESQSAFRSSQELGGCRRALCQETDLVPVSGCRYGRRGCEIRSLYRCDQRDGQRSDLELGRYPAYGSVMSEPRLSAIR